MKIRSLPLIAAVGAFALMAFSSPTPSEAGHVSFGYWGPRVGVYVGPRPYYGYYRPYRPYYYRPYRPYYRPYRPYYGPVYGGGRCVRWASRCAARWGAGGPNFRGCMRYHRCY